MTVEQMHWEFNLLLQKVASNIYEDFEPEEVDLFLNRAMERFIEDKYSPVREDPRGFAYNSKVYQDLSTLHKTVTLPLQSSYKTTRWVSYNPPDFLYPIKLAVSKLYNCEGVTLQTSAVTKHYYVIDLDFSSDVAPYFNNITLVDTSGPTTIFSSANYSAFITRVGTDADNKPDVVDLIIKELNKAGWPAYWEYWEDVYAQGKLIITAAAAGTITLNVDGSLVSTNNSLTKSATQVANTGTFAFVPVIVSDLENIDFDLKNPFRTTLHEFPKGEVGDRHFAVYNDEKFVLKEIMLTYIRRPYKISLYLGQNCELPVQTHQKVIATAVAMAKRTLESQAHELAEFDNQQND